MTKSLAEMTEWVLRLHAIGLPTGAISARTGWPKYRCQFAIDHYPEKVEELKAEYAALMAAQEEADSKAPKKPAKRRKPKPDSVAPEEEKDPEKGSTQASEETSDDE